MKILLTGATGYIGKRLLPLLIHEGHTVVCLVRDKDRFNPPSSLSKNIEVMEADLLNKKSLEQIPKDIDGAYYLVHSMSSNSDFSNLEKQSAINFRNAIERTECKQIIYLGGIINEKALSEHLISRKTVETELGRGKNYTLTVLRAGIIVGSGSASFEIIRDLVEKLPIMIAPKWLLTKCQPIAVSDVLKFLIGSLLNPLTYNKGFDIGGPEVLTYKEMLLSFAKVRGIKRKIFIIPVMTPKLSSYWLYFITSTSYKLASALVNSMKVEVVCQDNELNQIINIKPLPYTLALQNTFKAIEENFIVSSWKDSMVSSNTDLNLSEFVEVPQHGCYIDSRKLKVTNSNEVIDKIWKIGGTTGWYFGTWLWKLRGFLDKLFGGVGLRRGRTNPDRVNVGDAIDFWRVLYTDKGEGRLLLFAEMKLPGEAWLEFRITDGWLIQTATFRPLGLWGRIYWYAVLPFHGLIFEGLIQQLVASKTEIQLSL
jgi:uncharacterized protein YbjT (DUF2867 family)